MGTTPKPLRLLVDASMAGWEELAAMEAQGHTVVVMDMEGAWKPDVILGPRCWRMDGEHRKYLELAIKEARSVRYPKGKK